VFKGTPVFSQVMCHLPLSTFHRCVARYKGEHKVKNFSCLDQFYAMAFAQLTWRESLRDIEINLRAHGSQLFHLGFRCKTISRNTLANANAMRPWQIYSDLAQHLIAIARPMYVHEPLGVDLDASVYAFDATTIDLCLAVYPWALYRNDISAVKLHTLLDLHGNIPAFIHISDGKSNDAQVLDQLPIEPGAYYLLDRGYLDYARLHNIHASAAFFVTRAKKSTKFKRRYSCKLEDRSGRIKSDQLGVFELPLAQRAYPEIIRRIVVRDDDGDLLTFLTNNTVLKPQIIADLYRQRWQVELFFKWIKQHLRIKRFVGTTENAVKTQIWIAVCTYVLIAITKKRLQLSHSLYEILQLLSLSLFEKVPINQLLSELRKNELGEISSKQLPLL
jgi:IS4 transposase